MYNCLLELRRLSKRVSNAIIDFHFALPSRSKKDVPKRQLYVFDIVVYSAIVANMVRAMSSRSRLSCSTPSQNVAGGPAGTAVVVELVVVVSATPRAGSASSPHATAMTATETIRVIRANERRIGGETTVRAADLAWWALPRVRSAPV